MTRQYVLQTIFWLIVTERGMIRCEIPLKLNKYICYEINKAYQEKKTLYLSLEVVKNQWIWQIYMEI